MYKGIDVSDNQGMIDWAAVKAAGVNFAILRSVRRSGKPDNRFAANVQGCRDNGIPFEVYKYTYALTPTQAVEEAKQVCALLAAYGLKCRVWWDVEDNSLRALNQGILTGLIQSAADIITGAGVGFGIYTGKNFYESQVFDTAAFTCPMWIARYPHDNQRDSYPWADELPADTYKPATAQPLFGWQYTSKGCVNGIGPAVDLNVCYIPFWKVTQPGEARARQRLIDCAVKWLGCNEADGTHRQIIDMYNSHAPLARGYKLKYTDSWCAATVSAAAIAAGYTDIIPTECSCGHMAALFAQAGRWVEDDAYIPNIGDVIFYDWDDSGAGDNTGWPDHVGIVTSVQNGAITDIEGNKSDAVGYRTIAVNSKGIRGYGVPDYASKAALKPEYYLDAVWHGNSISRALESLGEDGSYAHRAKIAVANGIVGYSGTAEQNTHMLNLLRTGQLRRA